MCDTRRYTLGVAKSAIVLDIAPLDTDVDLDALAASLKSIQTPGISWGAYRLVPIAYGIKKLQQMLVLEDKAANLDGLIEMIE